MAIREFISLEGVEEVQNPIPIAFIDAGCLLWLSRGSNQGIKR
jgi:hypothetical protein